MRLIPFPGTSGPPSFQLSVDAYRTGATLSFSFHSSNFATIKGFGPRASPARKHDLWRTTCFEIFFRVEGEPAYWEINLSAAGDWQVYRFTSERQGRTEPTVPPPQFFVGSEEISATFDFSELDNLRDREFFFAPAAVLEDLSGGISYWAAAHLRPAPDFHFLENLSWPLLAKGSA